MVMGIMVYKGWGTEVLCYKGHLWGNATAAVVVVEQKKNDSW